MQPIWVTGNYNSTIKSAGFSLIELLVVLMIISIVFTGSLLSSSFISSERRLFLEAKHLQALIEQLRYQALIYQRPQGVVIKQHGYSAVAWQDDQWLPSTTSTSSLTAHKRQLETIHLQPQLSGDLNSASAQSVWHISELGIIAPGQVEFRHEGWSLSLSVEPNNDIAISAPKRLANE